MKVIFYSALLWGLAAACPANDRSGDWPVRDSETIEKTLALSEAVNVVGEPMRLVVDNVDGYVHVKGVPGSDVRVSAHKTIRAETDTDLAQARSEVKLNIEQKPGTVSVYYEAPWRCDGDNRSGCHGSNQHDSQRHFYNVTYDIDIEVPVAARLVVSAVNGGDIRIDKSAGDFEVSDINGGIHMSGIAGSGTVHTINGPVSVRFDKNPAAKCSFKSINGSLDVWFQPDFSADLLFKTFNGQVYSDFDVASRAIAPSGATERRDGKFVYRSNGAGAGRAGRGGPELSFDTLNGSIRLHREQ